ncbi:hypothetical protein EPUL_005444 [Erysiphe pulchra]|uniref:Mitochondrial carrier n=1 Tax=Erysiphe pulchra TaxID=225359 RepID=A0A2S4PN26_9PEZI|nr:hypothetical protein EPUL_005444 [Erysiphe pulchra]
MFLGSKLTDWLLSGSKSTNLDQGAFFVVDNGVKTELESIKTNSMAPQTLEEMSRPPYLHSMIAGGLGGTTGDLLMHSLDTVKTRQQGDPHFPPKYSSMSSSFNLILRQEGIRRGLYGGWLPALLGSFPGTVIFFGTYEYSKRNMIDHQISPQIAYLVSGFIADFAASFIYVPSEVLKTRLQLQGRYNNPFFYSGYNYKSTLDAARSIIRQEGVSALFYGYKATICRDLPFSALQFYFYEQGILWARKTKQSREIGLTLELMTGAISGGLAGIITCPLDVIKTRMQTQISSHAGNLKNFVSQPNKVEKLSGLNISPKQSLRSASASLSCPSEKSSVNLNTSSMIAGLRMIYKSEGLPGLFRGAGPRLVWTGVQSGFPSDNALRVLRDLALGTSCTMAFIFGIILDDRQRLIQTAHRTRRNIEILKSSKRYSTKGASVIRAFEEKTLRFENDIVEEKLQTGLLSDIVKPTKDQSTTTSKESTADYSLSHLESYKDVYTSSHREPCGQFQLRKMKQPEELSAGPRIQMKENVTCLTDLEQRIKSLIDQSPSQVETAAKLFVDTFKDFIGFTEGSLDVCNNRRALNLALTLFRACMREGRIDFSRKIFYSVMKRSIDEKIFIAFQLEKIIEQLMNGVSSKNLEEIISLYLATLDTYTESRSSQSLALGHKICETAFKYGKYHYVREIFDKMRSCFYKFPIESLSYFIIATSHTQVYQSDIFEYYIKYFDQVSFSENHHNKVVNVIVNHLLVNRMFAETEQVIATAAYLAKKAGYSPPAKPCLDLLRRNWETYQDLDKTMALFDRVQNYIQHVRHPCLFYESIIKICLEADDTLSAWSYYNKSQNKNCLKLRSILVQSTLLKAQEGDFEGVENDLRKIDRSDIADQYSKLFPKILKIYSSKNNMTKTENFIEIAFKSGISLNTNSINKIAELYAKERNFEALARLLHYVTNKGSSIDSSFINMILKQSYDSWKYSIDNVFLLVEIILKLKTDYPVVDVNTFLILRRLISSKRRASAIWKNNTCEKLNRIFEPYQLDPKNPKNPNHILSEMVVALNLNDPQEALAIYDWACSKNVRVGSKHLNVAVEASYRYFNGDISDGMKRIQNSGLSGPQTAESIALLFVHHLQQLAGKDTNSSDEIVQSTLNFISSFEGRGLQIPMQVITQTISTLERLRKYYDVGTFWDSISRRLGFHLVHHNIETLTVFLSTYIKLGYTPGFWKIFQIMIKNRIFPDQRFRLTLDNAKRRILFDLRSQKKPDPQKNAFLNTIIDGRALVNQIRARAFSERRIGTSKLLEKIEESLRIKDSPD